MAQDEVENLADKLKEYAGEGDLESLCLIYKSKLEGRPEKFRVVGPLIPGIIHSYYFANLPGFDYEKFKKWAEVRNSDWAKLMKINFADEGRLRAAIAHVKQAVADFNPGEART
ncbi:hypothetical protein [Inquilinus sp. CA228]|uniref:hypothetical protein n=1 Tax=Inquilinus sp. CA228 TaxID=3455609 RepID=UPI003F8D778F